MVCCRHMYCMGCDEPGLIKRQHQLGAPYLASPKDKRGKYQQRMHIINRYATPTPLL